MNHRKSKDRKYPFATMEVGETVTISVSMKPQHFRHYVYMRAAVLDRRFTTTQVAEGVFEVRRIDGLPNEDDLALSRRRK